MNFADKLLSHHSSVCAAIPFLLLVVAAVGLQYLQMSRLNARNPQAAQANPQAAMLQKYMPLIFGFIYLNVAAILNVYFIVSSAIRILTQEVLFRRGIVGGPPPPPTAGADPPARKGPKPPVVDRTERALPRPKAGSSRPGQERRRHGTAKTRRGVGRRRPSRRARPRGQGPGQGIAAGPTGPRRCQRAKAGSQRNGNEPRRFQGRPTQRQQRPAAGAQTAMTGRRPRRIRARSPSGRERRDSGWNGSRPAVSHCSRPKRRSLISWALPRTTPSWSS